ncbi:MAG: branched-chain amino acid ABC transporter permease [Clostridia bacterium]|nr:branched-chain amino acid ABC transporter permease [Clostridia bacterium]
MKNNVLKKLFSKNSITIYIVVAIYAIFSSLLYTDNLSRQLTNMLISVSCYIVLAVSLNLVVGFLGELSLGHACFMSVGLFTGCISSVLMSNVIPSVYIRLPIAMILGGLAAAAVGFVIGLPALRLKGDYLAIVTLACGEIVKNAITNINMTVESADFEFNGAIGLNTNKYGIYIKDVGELLPYAIVLVFVTIIVMMNISKSKAGRCIMAIRDNRIAAESIGINVTYYKLIVFVLAAFFAGMAGVLYGHGNSFAAASKFDYNMSIEILVIVVLGGMGSVRGSIIAAIILRALPEMLREFSDYRMLLYSVLLIVIMILNANPKFADLKGNLSIPKIISRLKNKDKTVKEAK